MSAMDVTNIPRLLQWLALMRPDAPLLLDAFCGAGGAAVGYWRAGFNVVGCDIAPQPRYPFPFVQMDAIEFIERSGRYADAIHASPPCQFASTGTKFKGTSHRYANMIPITRQALLGTGKPYVIENVDGAAKWMQNPVSLWGDLFGLRVIRVRLFECAPDVPQPLLASKAIVPMRGTASWNSYSTFDNGASHITVTGNNYKRIDGEIAMGIDWMKTRHELSESVPPAFTEYIGRHLMRVVRPATCEIARNEQRAEPTTTRGK